MGGFATLDDVEVTGKTILLRVDINSPLDPATGAFLDDTRIREVLPTLNRLARSAVVVLAHQSRPGRDDHTSLAPHARALSRLTNREVLFEEGLPSSSSTIARIEKLKSGQILMLENLRFLAEESMLTKHDAERLARTHLVRSLSSAADLFVNDAFACAHRNTASMTGLAAVMPSLAGLLMEKEVKKLEKAMKRPKSICRAILGGIKVDDSVDVARHLFERKITDEIWFTGGVANFMLHVGDVDIGEPSRSFLQREIGERWDFTINMAKELLSEYGDKIRLPTDLATSDQGHRVEIAVEELPNHLPILDLGFNSTQAVGLAIREAKTVILNGPAGVFEDSTFSLGTLEIIHACAETEAYTVLGGGHTSALSTQMGLNDMMGHVSTGGGACLDFLAGRPMPAIRALKDAYERMDTID